MVRAGQRQRATCGKRPPHIDLEPHSLSAIHPATLNRVQACAVVTTTGAAGLSAGAPGGGLEAGSCTCLGRSTPSWSSHSVFPIATRQFRPFLANVLRGRRISPERLEEVVSHYEHFGGVSLSRTSR